MSVCIEQNHQNNFSLSLSTCEQNKPFSFAKIKKVVRIWIERSRQRKQLAQLEDHLLEDIGLTRSQIQNEIAKPFWK